MRPSIDQTHDEAKRQSDRLIHEPTDSPPKDTKRPKTELCILLTVRDCEATDDQHRHGHNQRRDCRQKDFPNAAKSSHRFD